MVVEEGKGDDVPFEGKSTLYRFFTPERLTLTIKTQLSLVYAFFATASVILIRKSSAPPTTFDSTPGNECRNHIDDGLYFIIRMLNFCESIIVMILIPPADSGRVPH